MATLTEHLNTITIMELVTLLFRLASVKNQPLSFQIFFSNDPVNNIGRFYTRGRIMRLDKLGQTFVMLLVIRL